MSPELMSAGTFTASSNVQVIRITRLRWVSPFCNSVAATAGGVVSATGWSAMPRAPAAPLVTVTGATSPTTALSLGASTPRR